MLNFSEFDITGFDVSKMLSEKGIDIEMADLFNIVLIVTPSNTAEDLDALFSAPEQDLLGGRALRFLGLLPEKVLPDAATPDAGAETVKN